MALTLKNGKICIFSLSKEFYDKLSSKFFNLSLLTVNNKKNNKHIKNSSKIRWKSWNWIQRFAYISNINFTWKSWQSFKKNYKR